MPSTTCAFCGRFSHLTPKWAEVRRPRESLILLQGAAICDYCGRASLGVSAEPVGDSRTDNLRRMEATKDDSYIWFPRTAVAPEFPDVPQHIAVAAKEAHAASSIGASMAAILMARTVVEATAKEKGISAGTLVSKINALEAQGFIRGSTREAAHEIRHIGNDMAHGDIQDVPASEDAADVLALMDEVLNEVFQGPARAARIKSRRMDSA